MDERQFDRLTRLLASDGASRRRLLRGLAGGLVATLAGLGLDGGREAQTAGCFKKKKRCRHHDQCCSGRCRKGWCKGGGGGGGEPQCDATCTGCCDGQTCLPGTSNDACGIDGAACLACGDNATCAAGECACDGGFDACAGDCVDLQTDPGHCGACGISCEGGAECVSGVCACPAGTRDCNGRCLAEDACCGTCIQLSWGESPHDLDSHGWTPDGTEVFFQAKGTVAAHPFMELDVDDTTSFGPEQISISQLLPGLTSYAVHNFSNRCGDEGSDLAGSGATVHVTRDGVDLETFTAPATGDGVWWNVFQIDDDGTLIPIDEISNTPLRPASPVSGCGSGSGAQRSAGDATKDIPSKEDEPARTHKAKEGSGKRHESRKRRGGRSKRK